MFGKTLLTVTCALIPNVPPSLPLVPLGGQIRPSRSALSIPNPTCLCVLPSLCTRRRKTRCDTWHWHIVYNKNTFSGLRCDHLFVFVCRSLRFLPSSPQWNYAASCAVMFSRTRSSLHVGWVYSFFGFWLFTSLCLNSNRQGWFLK